MIKNGYYVYEYGGDQPSIPDPVPSVLASSDSSGRRRRPRILAVTYGLVAAAALPALVKQKPDMATRIKFGMAVAALTS